MLKRFSLATALLASTFTTGAQALEVQGTIAANAIIAQDSSNNYKPFATNSSTPMKKVYLMKVNLSSTEKQRILSYNPSSTYNHSQNTSANKNLPSHASVGMNGTPVLDQGQHGTCATFANTAAIDALLGKGDYVSQLCNLELGSHLEENGYMPGGWEGSWGHLVLDQMMRFGIVNKQSEHSHSCGGLTEYPHDADKTGNAMPLHDFKAMSENIADNLMWEPMLDFNQRFGFDPTYQYDGDEVLNKVKTIIVSATSNKENAAIVTFGILLPVDYCTSAGACGKHHVTDDSWVLTNQMVNDQSDYLAGHEMVITGYDDNATAIDHDGVTHKGLLTVRNSWSANAGDHGDYYISYDFFKKFVIEVQEIKVSPYSDTTPER